MTTLGAQANHDFSFFELVKARRVLVLERLVALAHPE